MCFIYLLTKHVVDTDHHNMLSAKGIVVLENYALTGNAFQNTMCNI